MNAERWTTASLLVVFGAIAVIGWWFHLRPGLEAQPASLGKLPARIESWWGRDLRVEQTVERMLRADYNLQRAYRDVSGSVVWMYVGYYGTRRGGTPEHTPWSCYPANGWTIASERRVEIDPGSGLRANELVVEQGDRRRLVHFWYRSFRSTGLLGTRHLLVDHVLGRIQAGRADGALVRVSTPLEPGEEDAARRRLLAFSLALDPLLQERWPVEVPSSS